MKTLEKIFKSMEKAYSNGIFETKRQIFLAPVCVGDMEGFRFYISQENRYHIELLFDAENEEYLPTITHLAPGEDYFGSRCSVEQFRFEYKQHIKSALKVIAEEKTNTNKNYSSIKEYVNQYKNYQDKITSIMG